MSSDRVGDTNTSRVAVRSGGVFPSAGDGPLRIVVLMGSEPGRRYPVEGDEMVIGRSESCHVQIDDSKVSRKHARLRMIDGQWELEDLESRNGTMLNGTVIEVPSPVEVGDRIQLSGDTLLLFTRQDPLEDLLLHRQQMEVIGQLAAGIAHDFNNLLNVISASVAHLAALPHDTKLGDPDVVECHMDVRAASRRAAELTARLLTLARRQHRGDSTRHRTVDMTELCSDVLQLARRTFDQSITIDHDVEPGLAVDGDHGALHQVLMNLCINARDAMPDGGRLTLRARVEATPSTPDPITAFHPGPQVVIEVEDTGVGMDEATRRRVFEPFFTTKEKGAGSGLGLSTVYEVATNHGGNVEVDSTPGEGLDVPRPPAREDDRQGEQLEHAPHPSDLGRPAAEDVRPRAHRGRPGARAAQPRPPPQGGRQRGPVRERREEALEIYVDRDRRPDIVLMDLDMPRLSGADTLERILEIDPGARVILISGYWDESSKRRLLAKGAVEFLGKPVDAPRLRDAVLAALGVPPL